MRACSLKKRGSTLASILLLTAIVGLLAFALAGSSVTHLQMSYKISNSDKALNLAESAIAVGLEKIVENPEFGKSRISTEAISLTGLPKNLSGDLSFDTSGSEDQQVFYSTNNLENDSAVPGSNGRMVPAHSVHLVGCGEVNGVSRKVEAIVSVPKFPYVVATSGRFSTDGETIIGSVESYDQLLGPSEDWDLGAGHVSSNSQEPEALNLGPETKVTGDAKASGGIFLENGAQVLGEVEENADKIEIPNYSVQDFDPDFTGKTGVSYIQQGSVQGAKYEGWVKRDGDLLVSDGLHLDNGILYVNGDLNVSGGITGTGALLVTGDTYVSGRSSLTSDNLAAIIGEGKITLQGDDAESSIFRGLVYSNESLQAENMTLVGTILVAGNDGDATLKDTRLIQSPDSDSLTLEATSSTSLYFSTQANKSSGDDNDDSKNSKSSNPSGAFVGTNKSGSSTKNKTMVNVSVSPDGNLLVFPDGGTEAEAIVASTPEEARQAVKSLVLDATGAGDLKAFDNTTSKKMVALLSDMQADSDPVLQQTTELITIDPSKLIGISDRMRLVLMREF